MEKIVKGYEFRFATHIPYKVNDDDYIVVKENIHYTDNTIEPHIRIIKNFKRDFYVTKQAYRNHKDKKESEEISLDFKFNNICIFLIYFFQYIYGFKSFFNNIEFFFIIKYISIFFTRF